MSLKDITITSSIKSLATQSYGQRTYVASSDLESFPIESITGSHVGAWPNFEPGTNYTTNLFINVTQSWSGSNPTVLGIVPYIHNTNDEFFNGEFSGSNYVVTDGNLTDEDCQQFLEVTGNFSNYNIFLYNSASSSFSSYLNSYTIPRNGEMLVYFESTTGGGNEYKTIKFVKIARIDKDGNDNTTVLSNATSIRWSDSSAGTILLTILSKSVFQNYILLSVSSITWVNTNYNDNNFLDYRLYATSSYSATLTTNASQYYYLTSSWTASIDSASGFNTSSGQYIFPLTPNFPIIYTASLNITASTNATFSWAINGYDPLYSIFVPNAADSSPLPISSIQNGLNTVYLNAGESRSLYITSSNNFPVQSYKYEIDALLQSLSQIFQTDALPNSDLTGSGAINNTNCPLPYAVIDPNLGFASYIDGAVYSLYDTYGIILNVASGGVGYDDVSNIAGNGNIDVLFRSDYSAGINNIFYGPVGKQYRIDIVVPSPTIIDDTTIGNQFDADYIILGPSLYDITCSYYKIDPLNPAYYLGVIPSGAYGTFSFYHTIVPSDPALSDGDICLFIPSGSSDTAASISGNGTGSMFVVEKIIVGSASAAPSPASVDISGLSFIITQSVVSQSNIEPILFEPYFTTNFATNDCNVLLNNSESDRISTSRRRVLYDDGSIIPSNIEQIISNSAEFANVNDYLYNANANTKPRYLGVRSTSPSFNQNATEGGYGTLPNVEVNQTYFAYYDYITSSYAELLNNSLAHILYLIDEQGNVLTPSLSSSYYYNLIDNFETNKNANITTDYLNTSLGGLKPILRPGAIPWGVCASQTGSGNNFNTTMSFSNNTSTTLVPNYASLVNGQTPYQTFPIQTGGGTYTVNLAQIVYNGAEVTVDLTPGKDYFKVNTTANNVTLNLKIEGTLGLSQQNSGAPLLTVSTQIYCQESPDGFSWANIDVQPITIVYGSPYALNMNFNSFSATANKYYRLRIYNPSGYFSIELYNAKISLVQNPIPTNSGIITSSYWTTGSNSKNILTGSQFLQLYNSYTAYQLNYADSGYKDFLEFNIIPSDEIRFEGDESQVYSIYGVTSDNKALYLELDRNISNGTNINSFLIRRYVPHPNFITLNWDITDFGNNIGASGFVFPEYPSETLKNNLPKIIEDLTNKSLI